MPLNRELISPKSIVVIGASSNTSRIGGKLLENLLKGKFAGDMYAINPKENEVQGIKCLQKEEIPEVELAIIAVSVKFVEEYLRYFAEEKNTKALL